MNIGITQKHFTDKNKINGGILYPIIIGEKDVNGKPLDIDITIPQYNGNVKLPTKISKIIGSDKDGFISKEFRSKIPLFLIVSSSKKEIVDQFHDMVESEHIEHTNYKKMIPILDDINKEMILIGWRNLYNIETGEEIKYTKTLAVEFLDKNPILFSKVLNVSQDVTNYMIGSLKVNLYE